MRVIRSRFERNCWDGFLTSRTSLKTYLGYVCLGGVVFDVFQLKYWSDDYVTNIAESKRERSEERR